MGQPQQPQEVLSSVPPFHRKEGTETYTGQPLVAAAPEKAGMSGKAGRVVMPESPHPHPQPQLQPQPQEELQLLLQQHIEKYPQFRFWRTLASSQDSICAGGKNVTEACRGSSRMVKWRYGRASFRY